MYEAATLSMFASAIATSSRTVPCELPPRPHVTRHERRMKQQVCFQLALSLCVCMQKYDLVAKFKEAGITAVLNLTEPGEHPHCGDGLEQSSGFPYLPEVQNQKTIASYLTVSSSVKAWLHPTVFQSKHGFILLFCSAAQLHNFD